MKEGRARCPDPQCGAYSDPGEEHHSPTCGLRSVEYKATQADSYYQAWLRDTNQLRQSINRLSEQVTFWQGKHAMLRHENNKLRRQNEKFRRIGRKLDT